MDRNEAWSKLESLLESSKVGTLTTIDGEGFPRSRWMTPVALRGRNGYVYAVTAPDSAKARHIAANGKVQWSVQSRSLDAVVTAVGNAVLVDDPLSKAEVLEAIGPNLQIFWRVNPKSKNLVVVETKIAEIDAFFPMSGERTRAELE